MKILLDECLPLDLRHHVPGHEVHTAQWAGFKGKNNGDLIQSAETSGYEVLLTVDQGNPRSSSTGTRTITVIVLRSRTNQLEDLIPLVPAILQALESIESGKVVVVPAQ